MEMLSAEQTNIKYLHILFYAEAWKAEGSLTLDLASVSSMVVFHARRHEIHHYQIHNQRPEMHILVRKER